MISSSLASWLDHNGFRERERVRSISGGDTSQALLIKSADGSCVFVKQREEAPTDFFAAEAEGLNFLQRVCNLSLPQVLGYGRSFIAMEYIPPGIQQPRFWELLAQQLANMHTQEREQFGFINNNYCGLSIQRNDFCLDGYSFFAKQRILPQAEQALASNLLSHQDYDAILKLCDALADLVPKQAASLLHGDLWSGNIHVSPDGDPVFIDPAIYFAWAEIDIAMTLLFGGFPERFYQAYLECRSLESGWRERMSLYNLYPLLNHLNLFGRGYLSEVRAVLTHFVKRR